MKQRVRAESDKGEGDSQNKLDITCNIKEFGHHSFGQCFPIWLNTEITGEF